MFENFGQTKLMGCCCSITNISNYDVVLKLPDGKEYLHFENDKFVKKTDINLWIKSLYSCQQMTSYIVYNDEHHDKVNGTSGHCKGIVAWNMTSITWLVHSVPNFPERFDGKLISELPESGLLFGQSFIFVKNIPIDNLEIVLQNLYSMHPSIYMSTVDIPKRFSMYENKCKLLKPVFINNDIMHIAKTSKHELDIYEHLAMLYGGEWKARTWIRGHDCKDTSKVKTIKLCIYENFRYKHTRDHSKYACNHEYVIIGDLNKMTTQFDRGGGGIVVKNKTLAKEINKLFK